MIGIYSIRNKINGKMYIGRSNNIERRWGEEKNGQVNSHLCRAFLKYGIENFEFSVVEECSMDIIGEREKFYIEKYRSNEKELGYNKTTGGYGGIPGYSHTDEWKKERAEAMRGSNNHNYGKPMHPNCYAVLNTRKGKDHPCYGKKRPREVFAWKMRPVICVETGEWFDSYSAAGRSLGLSGSNLVISLKNPKRTFGGFHWKYADEKENQ